MDLKRILKKKKMQYETKEMIPEEPLDVYSVIRSP